MRILVSIWIGANVALSAFAQSLPVADPPAVAQSDAADAPTRRLGAFVQQIDGVLAPSAVAFAASGDLYIAEAGGNRVSIFSADGRWLRYLGAPAGADAATSQPAIPAPPGTEPGQFDRPAGVAVAPDGSVFVADTGNHRIQVFNPAGEWVRSFGQRGSNPDDLYEPRGLAADAGRLYVVDSGNHRVQVYSHDGQRQLTLGAYGTTARPGDLRNPRAVAVDAAGNIFVADTDNHRLHIFRPDGTPTSVFGERGYMPGLVAEPRGIAVTGDNLFVADSMNHRIQVFDLDGKKRYDWGLHVVRPRDGGGRLHYPEALAASADGKLLAVAESSEDRVQLFGPRPADEGKFPDWNRPDPELGSHFGEYITIAGDMLFLSEPETGEIHVYDQTRPKPLQYTLLGGYGSEPGRFHRPAGMCFVPANRRLYVCDPGNQRVQSFVVDSPPRPLAYDAKRAHFVAAYQLMQMAPAPDGAPVEPAAIAPLTRDGAQLLVLDRRNARLLQLDAELGRVDVLPPLDPPLLDPTDMAVYDDWWTWVYLVDAGARRVRVLACDRDKRWRNFGGADLAEMKSFVDPFGVACAPDGSIYVTDAGTNTVTAFGPKGGPQFDRWGEKGIAAGHFMRPRGIAVDSSGIVTVVDHGNHRGQTFTGAGDFLRMFGARWYCKPAEEALTTRPAWPPAAWVAAPKETAARPVVKSASQSPATATPEMRATSLLGRYEVIAAPSMHPIPLNREFDLSLVVRDVKSGQPVPPDAIVTFDADMPEHRHGLTTRPELVSNSAGRYRLKGLRLHMPGYWELFVDVSRDGVVERISLPLELE